MIWGALHRFLQAFVRHTPSVRGHGVAALLRPCAWLAGLLVSAAVQAQTSDCPAPGALLPQQLHGAWTAQFAQPPAGWPAQARVRLQAHVEFKDSVSGTAQRSSGPTALAHLAGDLDDGVLLMDESSDGVHITAVWEGAVVSGSCGREIRGYWKDTRKDSRSAGTAETPFVLTRSQP